MLQRFGCMSYMCVCGTDVSFAGDFLFAELEEQHVSLRERDRQPPRVRAQRHAAHTQRRLLAAAHAAAHGRATLEH